MNLDFSKIDKAHDDMSEALEYADSTKADLRNRSAELCLALNELQEQRRKGIYNDPDKERAVKEWSTNEVESGMDYVAWCHYKGSSIETCDSDSEGAFKVYRRPVSPDTGNLVQDQDRKDLLECESILSSVVDFVNIWSREAGLPEIHSAGQITKAIDKLWSCASFRDVTMQSTLSSIAANSCCKTCQEAGRVAANGLRVASLGERLWIHRTPAEFDPSRYDAQGNAKPSAETPHQ